MLRAETEGVTPEKLISLMYNEHLRDFTNFHIKFDNYYTTHSPETSYYSKDIYNKLKDAGLIAIRNIEQFYDPVKNMFLPDRFIKGECPKCSAKDQYGDNCEACGAAYAPNDLINPYSVISGTPPITKIQNTSSLGYQIIAASISYVAGQTKQITCSQKLPTKCKNG